MASWSALPEPAAPWTWPSASSPSPTLITERDQSHVLAGGRSLSSEGQRPSPSPSSTEGPSMSTAAPPDPVIPSPRALTRVLEDGMYAKATTAVGRMFLLSLTGGAYIAQGSVFLVPSQLGMTRGRDGVTQVLGGLVFSVGPGLVVISGSALSTGTTMTSVPWLSKRVSTAVMLKHWAVSILGNLTGA